MSLSLNDHKWIVPIILNSVIPPFSHASNSNFHPRGLELFSPTTISSQSFFFTISMSLAPGIMHSDRWLFNKCLCWNQTVLFNILRKKAASHTWKRSLTDVCLGQHISLGPPFASGLLFVSFFTTFTSSNSCICWRAAMLRERRTVPVCKFPNFHNNPIN